MRTRTFKRAALLTLVVLGAVLAGASPALAALETPVTKPVSALTGVSVTFNGELNPHSTASAGYYFEYNAGGECAAGRATAPEPEVTGKAVKVSAQETGLTPSSEYSVCVVATHLEGEVNEVQFGLPVTFHTLAMKPSLEAERASGVTPFAATLEAEINPNNQNTTGCVFEYGPTNTYGTSTPCQPEELGGYGNQTVSLPLTGLTPSSTLHYRVIVKNATGETTGADAEVTTLPVEAPAITGESVSGLTAIGAELNAQVDPDYQTTSCQFLYWPETRSESEATSVPCSPGELGTGGTPVAVTAIIGGLAPGESYDYRAVASNTTGPTKGLIEHFTALAGPQAATTAATGVTQSTATLSGTVNPAGSTTGYYFAYVSQAGYEAAVREGAHDPYIYGATTPLQSAGSEYTAQPAGPVQLAELAAGRTYHYAIIATNTITTTISTDRTFTTNNPTPPLATTGEAQNITQTSATITGSINTQGLPTTPLIELGTTPEHSATQPPTSTTQSGNTLNLTLTDTNLQPSTPYYYRAIGISRDGTGYGNTQTFTTTSYPPATTLPPALPPLGYTPIPQLLKQEAEETPKPLTNKQKLDKALKACHKKHNKHKRTLCEKQAHHEYPTGKHGK